MSLARRRVLGFEYFAPACIPTVAMHYRDYQPDFVFVTVVRDVSHEERLIVEGFGLVQAVLGLLMRTPL